MTDPGIICFRHTCENTIFCREVPKNCPICESIVTNYLLVPFRIPYPFVNAIHNPTTIVLRPSAGTFLDDYNVSDDLHIAVVNSEGYIVEFDTCGIIINNFSNWTNCVSLKVIPESWESHWDRTLETIRKNVKWNADNYNEVSMNCFSFVIEFLNLLTYPGFHFSCKEDLCKELILPKIQDTLRYISIYRNLKNNNYLVLN
ncbi:MKRN2 opposite strand protein [Orussus abietinus]|uniref:MKRN2 opposite strand protein n=1 Tax=Orussus abietinus TaxID=222816 RepID=UPI000626156C|nr:MKRN2 opposite strand protein [Orussus abietinus]